MAFVTQASVALRYRCSLIYVSGRNICSGHCLLIVVYFKQHLESVSVGIGRGKGSLHLGPLYRFTVNHWTTKKVLIRMLTVNRI